MSSNGWRRHHGDLADSWVAAEQNAKWEVFAAKAKPELSRLLKMVLAIFLTKSALTETFTTTMILLGVKKWLYWWKAVDIFRRFDPSWYVFRNKIQWLNVISLPIDTPIRKKARMMRCNFRLYVFFPEVVVSNDHCPFQLFLHSYKQVKIPKLAISLHK